ncbi:MAG: D-2-hydroxyacid dehydrogenase [Thermoprotei archaeon]
MKILVCHKLNHILTEKLKTTLRGHELVFANDYDEAMKYAPDADVIIGMAVPGKIIKAAQKVKLIQAVSAGVDRIDLDVVKESNIPLCNVRGAYSIPVAEHAIALIMTWELKLLKQFEHVKSGKWTIVFHGEITGKVLGIIGYGSIGHEIAKRGKSLGMKILTIKRELQKQKDDFVDFLGSMKDLDLVLKESDYVVIALPLTKETYHLISEKELKTMKPNAVLVNISRGAIIDEKALIKALKEKWIAGALLDVLEKEPPEPTNPLLSMDNVIITPHTSGITEKAFERVANIVSENITRLENGEKLLNQVDLIKEY